MKKIRFILQSYGQCGIDVFKDYYFTEIVEVSDRAYDLLLEINTNPHQNEIHFMGAERIKDGEK